MCVCVYQRGLRGGRQVSGGCGMSRDGVSRGAPPSSLSLSAVVGRAENPSLSSSTGPRDGGGGTPAGGRHRAASASRGSKGRRGGSRRLPPPIGALGDPGGRSGAPRRAPKAARKTLEMGVWGLLQSKKQEPGGARGACSRVCAHLLTRPVFGAVPMGFGLGVPGPWGWVYVVEPGGGRRASSPLSLSLLLFPPSLSLSSLSPPNTPLTALFRLEPARRHTLQAAREPRETQAVERSGPEYLRSIPIGPPNGPEHPWGGRRKKACS